MILAEGQTHVHRINFKPNKYMSKEIEILDNANIRGLTMYQLIVCYACPSDPRSNAVTTSNCKIDWFFVFFPCSNAVSLLAPDGAYNFFI